MTAREALDLWEACGDAVSLPQLFRDMGLARLRILVAEEAKPPQRSAMDRTPARKRASFSYHLAVCGCVAEAAARAQVSRSTLYRWRDDLPGFAELWDKAIVQRQRVVGDDIVLQAGQVELQPVVYAGKAVGQRSKVNTQLLMHVQKRLDADRRRTEDRAERRELALLRARPVDEEALVERLLVLIERRRETSHPAPHAATPETPESANANKDLADAA